MSKEITEKLSSKQWPEHAKGRAGTTDVIDPSRLAGQTQPLRRSPGAAGAQEVGETTQPMPTTGAGPITAVMDARMVRALAGREVAGGDAEPTTDVVSVDKLPHARRPLAKPIVQAGEGEAPAAATPVPDAEQSTPASGGASSTSPVALVVLAVVAIAVGVGAGLWLS